MTFARNPFQGRKFTSMDGFHGVSSQLGILGRFVSENVKDLDSKAGNDVVRKLNKELSDLAERLRLMTCGKGE